MLDKFNVSNSLTWGAFNYTYRIIVPPLLFIFTLTFEPVCNIHVCMLYACLKSHRFRNLINVNLLSFPFFRSTDEVCIIELRTFILNLKASNCVCYVYQALSKNIIVLQPRQLQSNTTALSIDIRAATAASTIDIWRHNGSLEPLTIDRYQSCNGSLDDRHSTPKRLPWRSTYDTTTAASTIDIWHHRHNGSQTISTVLTKANASSTDGTGNLQWIYCEQNMVWIDLETTHILYLFIGPPMSKICLCHCLEHVKFGPLIDVVMLRLYINI